MDFTTPIDKALSREDLVQIFQKTGVKAGMTLEVHSSLSACGYIIGGAETVVDALLEAVGYEGTLVMPLQASWNSDPSEWENPPADPKLWEKIRRNIPPFDPLNSETPYMGAVVNNFRRRQGVYFTRHPTCAFAAYGKYAKLICSRQNLHYSLGENSPLRQLYDLRAHVLLIGCGYQNCTAMHLGEYQSHCGTTRICSGALDRGYGREWASWLDLDLHPEIFPDVGKQLESAGKVHAGKIGKAPLRLFRMTDAVNQTRRYLIQKEKERR